MIGGKYLCSSLALEISYWGGQVVWLIYSNPNQSITCACRRPTWQELPPCCFLVNRSWYVTLNVLLLMNTMKCIEELWTHPFSRSHYYSILIYYLSSVWWLHVYDRPPQINAYSPMVTRHMSANTSFDHGQVVISASVLITVSELTIYWLKVQCQGCVINHYWHCLLTWL